VIGSWALALAIHSQLGGEPTRLYEAYCAALRCPDVAALAQWSREHVTSDERRVVPYLGRGRRWWRRLGDEGVMRGGRSARARDASAGCMHGGWPRGRRARAGAAGGQAMASEWPAVERLSRAPVRDAAACGRPIDEGFPGRRCGAPGDAPRWSPCWAGGLQGPLIRDTIVREEAYTGEQHACPIRSGAPRWGPDPESPRVRSAAVGRGPIQTTASTAVVDEPTGHRNVVWNAPLGLAPVGVGTFDGGMQRPAVATRARMLPGARPPAGDRRPPTLRLSLVPHTSATAGASLALPGPRHAC